MNPPTAAPAPKLHGTYVACGMILAIDVLLLGAPALGMATLIALILWILPSILFAWRKPDLRRHRALVALVTAGAVAADMAAYAAYEAIAEKRVTEVADALAQYKSRHGTYPKTLQNLVPDYLPAIPAAKSGLVVLNDIWYRHNESGPTVAYTSFPPLGSRVLNVETRAWTMPN